MPDRETENAQAFLGQLRERFIAVARRRVPEDAAEDLVQEALAIVYDKGIRLEDQPEIEGLPPLAWCFQVLRNVIGNFYQKQRTRSRETDIDEVHGLPTGTTPLEALATREEMSLLLEALEALAEEDPRCGQYLRQIGEGRSPADLAGDEGVKPAILYRRVYRCRGKLRTLLEAKGILA